MKQDGLSIEEFETKLRTQARKCVLGDLTDDLTCHAFVEGVDEKKLRDKLAKIVKFNILSKIDRSD